MVSLAESLRSLDLKSLAERYRQDDGLLVLPDVIPPTLVEAMAEEAQALSSRSRRTRIPFVRKAGAIGHYDVTARAPSLRSLHRSPELLALAESISGHDLEHRHDRDPHASGLYLYERPGDWVDWHYDDCGCVAEASFTIIAGIVDESSSRLEVELHRKSEGRAPERREIATTPGTIVFFRGSSVYHRVTKLRRGERRIAFSFVYVRKGLRPRGFDRLWQTYIDTFLYFGHKGLPRSASLWRDMLPR